MSRVNYNTHPNEQADRVDEKENWNHKEYVKSAFYTRPGQFYRDSRFWTAVFFLLIL